MARFEETMRRLAMFDEGFVGDSAGLRFNPGGAQALDPKIVALQVGVSVALGTPTVCLQWATGRCRDRARE